MLDILNGGMMIFGGTFKAAGGVGLTAASAATSASVITVSGIGAGVVTASAGASDIKQGFDEIRLGIKGDSSTITTNGMCDMLYDGNTTMYHVSTGIAATIGMMLLPYVQTQYGRTTLTPESKSATTNISNEMAESKLESYVAPSGGGGITSILKINGKTIRFGHGARHLVGTGLNISEVNQALAKEVETLNLGIGQFYKGRIVINEITIEYTSYGISEDVISIGTYYPVQ